MDGEKIERLRRHSLWLSRLTLFLFCATAFVMLLLGKPPNQCFGLAKECFICGGICAALLDEVVEQRRHLRVELGIS